MAKSKESRYPYLPSAGIISVDQHTGLLLVDCGDPVRVRVLVWQALEELSRVPNTLFFFPLAFLHPSPSQQWAEAWLTELLSTYYVRD